MHAYFSYKALLAVAVVIYTLIFGMAALVPVYSLKGKRKNVSAVMWIIPIVGVVLVTLFGRWAFFVWFWEDPYQMGYFKWILLATVALCLFINNALGEYASTIEENGIRSRRFIGSYRLFLYEIINEYAKSLRPFCYKNYLYIYYGKTHLAFEILTSFGGKAFLKELSEKLNIEYSYFEEQIKGDQVKNFRMYCLMMALEKAERKRFRKKKKGRRRGNSEQENQFIEKTEDIMDKNSKKLVDYVCGKSKSLSFFLWCLFVLIIIPIAGITAMCIIDPELLLFEGDYEVLWILQLLLMMGVCSVYYFKFIVSMKEHREELKIKYNGLNDEQKQEILDCAKIYREISRNARRAWGRFAYDTFYISDNYIYGNLAICKTQKSLILSPVVFEYISLKDVEVAKKDTFLGNTVLVMYTKDKKIYRCRAEEKKIKELAERIKG